MTDVYILLNVSYSTSLTDYNAVIYKCYSLNFLFLYVSYELKAFNSLATTSVSNLNCYVACSNCDYITV